MRSGREHLAWILAVEVRQGTLGVDGRGGPAGNTGRGWSWLRSDREHCASRVAVEQEEEERRGGEEQATDIKSNNPHLAGGEKHSRPSAQEQTQPSQLAHGFRRFARSKKTGSTIQKNGFHLKVPSFDHWQGPRMISQLERKSTCLPGVTAWASPTYRFWSSRVCHPGPGGWDWTSAVNSLLLVKSFLPLDMNEITPTNAGLALDLLILESHMV